MSKRWLVVAVVLGSLALPIGPVVPAAHAAYESHALGMTNAPKGDASRTLRVDKPVGVTEGDFLLAQITFEKGASAGTNAQITPPGWTLIRRTNSQNQVNGTDLGQAIFSKVANATDESTASYNWPFRQAVKAAGGIIRLTEVDVLHANGPVAASSGNASSSTSLSAPSVNAPEDSIVFAFYGMKKKDTMLSVPSGMTGRYNFQNPQDVTIMAADELPETGAATGPRVSTPTPNNSGKWVAQLVALRLIDETGSDPVALDDGATVAEDADVTTIDVLANDSDVDPGDVLTVTGVDTTGTAGLVAVTNGGANVSYDPNGQFDDLGQGDEATDTFGYTVTDATGRTATATVTVTITGGLLTITAMTSRNAFDPDNDPSPVILSPTEVQSVDGGQDNVVDATVDNVPASGASYLWRVDVPGENGYLVAPVQTRSTLFIRTFSIPDFGPESIEIVLTVTPNNGSAAASRIARARYTNSELTVARATTLDSTDPGIVPHATPKTISTDESLVITQTHPGEDFCCAGTATYTVGNTVLGTVGTLEYGVTTPTAYDTPFEISGATLGAGTHTITVTYEVYVDVRARLAFSKDVTVTVTAP